MRLIRSRTTSGPRKNTADPWRNAAVHGAATTWATPSISKGAIRKPSAVSNTPLRRQKTTGQRHLPSITWATLTCRKGNTKMPSRPTRTACACAPATSRRSTTSLWPGACYSGRNNSKNKNSRTKSNRGINRNNNRTTPANRRASSSRSSNNSSSSRDNSNRHRIPTQTSSRAGSPNGKAAP